MLHEMFSPVYFFVQPFLVSTKSLSHFSGIKSVACGLFFNLVFIPVNFTNQSFCPSYNQMQIHSYKVTYNQTAM